VPAVLACLLFAIAPARADEAKPLQLRILGSLAGVSQFVQHERPFWSEHIAKASGGRIVAQIVALEDSGIRGQEVLHMLRLGVVTFGTAILNLAAVDDPELNAPDLPALNPDFASLRNSSILFRPRLDEILRERYGIEPLAVYAYPAQVVFCARPFEGLRDLAGRTVRTSSVSQAEMFEAVGAKPVVTPFATIVQAVRDGVVECAVTGTLSGNAIGLHEVTTHVHGQAVNWGLSVFGANRAAWAALPEWARTLLRREIAGLERAIWESAERETGMGLDCNVGAPTCIGGRRGHMTLVRVSPGDEALRRRLLVETVLPRWISRCGRDCVDTWNNVMAPGVGVALREE